MLQPNQHAGRFFADSHRSGCTHSPLRFHVSQLRLQAMVPRDLLLIPQRTGHNRASPRMDGEHSLSARLLAPGLPHQDRPGDGVLHSLRRGAHEWNQPHPVRLAPQAAVRSHAALLGLLQRGQLQFLRSGAFFLPSSSVVVQAIAAARIPRLHAMRAAHALGVLPAQTPRLRECYRVNSLLAIRTASRSRSHRDPAHRESPFGTPLSSSRRSFCTTESFSTRPPSPMKYV